MSSIEKLDLRGVVLPVSLLKYSHALSEMGSHECLEIPIHDQETADELVRIIERSQDRVVHRRRAGNHFRIRIGPISDQRSDGSKGRGLNSNKVDNVDGLFI